MLPSKLQQANYINKINFIRKLLIRYNTYGKYKKLPQDANIYCNDIKNITKKPKNNTTLFTERKYSKYLNKSLVNFDTNLIKRNYCCESGSNAKQSIFKHKYSDECEKVVNKQITAELNASFAYLNMAAYFGRTEVALPGCYGFFMNMHEEELEHAHIFMNYQNLRGGRVKLLPLTGTDCSEWTIKKALEVSLEMEKLIKEKLISAHDVAEKDHDLNLMDMITTDFILDQEKSICEFGRLLARINNMGCSCGCAEFLFDKEIFDAFVKNHEPIKKDYKKLLYK